MLILLLRLLLLLLLLLLIIDRRPRIRCHGTLAYWLLTVRLRSVNYGLLTTVEWLRMIKY